MRPARRLRPLTTVLWIAFCFLGEGESAHAPAACSSGPRPSVRTATSVNPLCPHTRCPFEHRRLLCPGTRLARSKLRRWCQGEPSRGPRVSGPSAQPNPIEPLIREGAIIRAARTKKRLALVFTGHEFAEGGATIAAELARHQAKGSFFLTGDFLRNTNHHALVARLVSEGHYLGPHSDKHVLYCPWDGPKKTLISDEEFRADLEANLRAIETFGVKRQQVRFFLPPYEYYNQEIADWSKAMGLTLVNFTPGTRSNADYTSEPDKNFVSSRLIFESIIAKEKQDPNGLNGFLLLLHIGSGPGRQDKFHVRFGELLDYLAGKGYEFVRVDELLEAK